MSPPERGDGAPGRAPIARNHVAAARDDQGESYTRPVTIGEALDELLVAWQRRAVRRARRHTDGIPGSPRERRLVTAYDRLVDREAK